MIRPKLCRDLIPAEFGPNMDPVSQPISTGPLPFKPNRSWDRVLFLRTEASRDRSPSAQIQGIMGIIFLVKRCVNEDDSRNS